MPRSVIGSPPGSVICYLINTTIALLWSQISSSFCITGEGEGGGHRKKRATEGGDDSHGASESDSDRTFCVQDCMLDRWSPVSSDVDPNADNVCYGKSYATS